jgi:hypothetical protein
VPASISPGKFIVAPPRHAVLNFRVARYPRVFAIDSHKPTSAVLIVGAIVSVASRPASSEEMQWVCGSFHL